MPMSPNETLRGLRGRFNRRRNDDDYLLFPNPNFPFGYLVRDETDDDDTSSISSHSTNSTVDDNPGPGRLIDKHIYQKLGRKVERVIFRIKLPGLPPARIYGFFKEIHPGNGYELLSTGCYTMEGCMNELMKFQHAKIRIYGLKCLVKQTQSSSVHQSAAALITLMRATMFHERMADFYICISQLEPIFHAETLVISDNDSGLIKKYTLLLVRLAKAHTIAIKNIMIDPRILSQDFLCLLETLPRRPVADGLFEPVSEACRIYAHALAASDILSLFKLPGVNVSVLETICFIIVFFLRSIPILWTQISSLKDQKTQQFIGMVLSALSNWLDCSFQTVISATSRISDPDNKLMEIRIAFYGVVHIHPYAKMILPQSFNNLSTYFSTHFQFPRRVCGLCRLYCPHIYSRCTGVVPPVLQALLDQSKSRLIRLHASFTALEREVRDRTIMRAHNMLERAGPDMDHKLEVEYESRLTHKRTLFKALQARVNENELTEEFRFARSHHPYDFRNYKIKCLWRSKWAQFFLSNLDWNWDLAGSLEQLYALDESTPIPPAHAQQPGTHIATIDAEGAVGRTWDMKTRTTQQRAHLPKEVRIPYASKTGDIKYMVFARDAEVPGDSTGGRTSDRDGYAEERRSVGTAEVDMCAGGSGSSGTQYFMGEIAGVEGNDATTSLETPSDSGPSLNTQKCDSVSWKTQDVGGPPVIPCVEEESECEAFIEELASDSEGGGTTFGMSAKSAQVPPKGIYPTTSFTQHTSFATEFPENQAFIEELDDEKDEDEGTTTSKTSNELFKQVSSNEIDSASAFTGQTRFAFVGQTGMKWFQIVGIVCASILLERLIIVMLGHFFGTGGKKV